MALGVPTDGAGPRHTITCDAAQHNNPTAGGAALAEVDDNSAVASALRVLVRPFSEQGGPERQRPILALVDHAASAKSSFLNDGGIEPPQHRYQRPL
jgi:hypothetical protein